MAISIAAIRVDVISSLLGFSSQFRSHSLGFQRSGSMRRLLLLVVGRRQLEDVGTGDPNKGGYAPALPVVDSLDTAARVIAERARDDRRATQLVDQQGIGMHIRRVLGVHAGIKRHV
ncbi:hypothetical protein A7Y00_14595 [Stenotrophomonas maltophilia]|nr:hypothetical protein A7Y00_14595 [Stenotrophomonas maltophilia]